MTKTFKNLLLQKNGCLWAESLQKSSGTGDLPKLIKWWSYIDVWLFLGEVKFASICICMGPIHLYGKNVDSFKWPPLKPLVQCCLNFMWSLLGAGQRKIGKMVMVHWPRWLPCPYIVETFKNLPLQNQISPGALSLHKSSGTGDLPKVLKSQPLRLSLMRCPTGDQEVAG